MESVLQGHVGDVANRNSKRSDDGGGNCKLWNSSMSMRRVFKMGADLTYFCRHVHDYSCCLPGKLLAGDAAARKTSPDRFRP